VHISLVRIHGRDASNALSRELGNSLHLPGGASSLQCAPHSRSICVALVAESIAKLASRGLSLRGQSRSTIGFRFKTRMLSGSIMRALPPINSSRQGGSYAGPFLLHLPALFRRRLSVIVGLSLVLAATGLHLAPSPVVAAATIQKEPCALLRRAPLHSLDIFRRQKLRR
jgi:hypothetical protein